MGNLASWSTTSFSVEVLFRGVHKCIINAWVVFYIECFITRSRHLLLMIHWLWMFFCVCAKNVLKTRIKGSSSREFLYDVCLCQKNIKNSKQAIQQSRIFVWSLFYANAVSKTRVKWSRSREFPCDLCFMLMQYRKLGWSDPGAVNFHAIFVLY
jgi:hypothetical protein